MVWNKNVKTNGKFMLSFCNALVDKNDNDSRRTAEYNPDTDTFVFAMDQVKERSQEMKLSISDTILLVAAHETMHKVQFYRGDKMIPAPKGNKFTSNYYIQNQEVEAWNEALDLFKKIHPNSQGGFTFGTKRYLVPKTSSY